MRKVPSVLHVINSLDIGGTEKQLYLLLKHLDPLQFSSTVVALSQGGYWADRIPELGIELRQLKRRGSFELKRMWQLTSLVRSLRPDIVHTWQPSGNLYGGIAAQISGHRRLIVSYRSIDRYRGFRAVVEGRVFAAASAVVCNSKALSEDLLTRGRATTAPVVIHNGIEFIGTSSENGEGIRAQLGLPPSSKVVGTVGRMVPFKNQKRVIQVAARILRQRDDCYFLLIGDGPIRSELQSQAQRLGVSERVRFLGKRNDVPALLGACDVFLFPSQHLAGIDGVAGEGFPNAVMEAMQAGLPCIASSTSGAAELFADGEAGYLLDPDDEAGFARALLKLLEQDQLRMTLGSRGRDIISQRYSAEAMTRHIDELYSSLL